MKVSYLEMVLKHLLGNHFYNEQVLFENWERSIPYLGKWKNHSYSHPGQKLRNHLDFLVHKK